MARRFARMAVVTYPFVRAAVQLGRRRGPVKAFVVHFAEGGGTVGFLSRPNIRSVSVHYVIERTGRIVQMVEERDATGSINPNDIRTTDDPDGFYGISVTKRVMGDWWRDPNSAAITLEIEGFAADGPNALQAKSLRILVEDVRSRFPSMGLLGHRDFTSRKACPGKRIDWPSLGGHGPATPDTTAEEPVITFTWGEDATLVDLTVPDPGHSYLRLRDGTLHPVTPPFAKRALGPVVLPTGTVLGDSLDRRTGYVIGAEAAFLLKADVRVAPVVVVVPDCSKAVNDALDHLTGPVSALATAITAARP